MRSSSGRGCSRAGSGRASSWPSGGGRRPYRDRGAGAARLLRGGIRPHRHPDLVVQRHRRAGVRGAGARTQLPLEEHRAGRSSADRRRRFSIRAAPSRVVIETLREKARRNAPREIRVAAPFYKPSRNRTARVPDYYLHETEEWIKFPHSLEGLTLDEIGAPSAGSARGASRGETRCMKPASAMHPGRCALSPSRYVASRVEYSRSVRPMTARQKRPLRAAAGGLPRVCAPSS